MSQPTTRKYPAALKERAVKLAVDSEQPMAQTARDLGVHENTLHTWLGTSHRAERQEKEVNDDHLSEERKRLRQENARWQAERDLLKKAAASCAHQLPYRPRGLTSSIPRSRSGAWVSSCRSRGVVRTRGGAARPAPRRKLRSTWSRG